MSCRTFPRRRSGVALFIVASVACTIAAATLGAAEPPPPYVFSPAERVAIARAFAPTLVFHSLEDYLPTSSAFPFDSDDLPPSRGEGVAALRVRLGSPPVRVARYLALSQAEKIERASLQYRVFSRVRHNRVEVVVEYWCYYVYNAFRVRGTWLPYSVSDNHAHDLERIYLVLTPTEAAGNGGDVDEAWARRAFQIRRVITNAHDGSIPPNEYEAAPDEVLTPPLTVLVERGSHAMAPDINRDGRFTPGVDSTRITKLLWGIRDRGATWGRYRSSYMDHRDQSSVRLCGPAVEPDREAESCPHYSLSPADELQSWFSGFQFSRRDLHEIVGRTSWINRAFGDVRVENLMVPSDPADGRVLEAMLHRHRRAEAGFVAGFTTVAQLTPALIVGRRYFWDVQSRYAPDVMAEAVALFPAGGRRAVEATVWGSYSVDAISNALIGIGWFSNGAFSPDVVTGVDLRVGRFRIRPSWRLRQHTFDSRLVTLF